MKDWNAVLKMLAQAKSVDRGLTDDAARKRLAIQNIIRGQGSKQDWEIA